MGTESSEPIRAVPEPPRKSQAEPVADEPLDKKAELRSRLFSSQANDHIIPVPPKPPEPKPENDASLLAYVALAFFALSIGAFFASPHIVFSGAGPNPLEALAMLSSIAAVVIGLWWFFKANKFKFQFIPPDEDN